LDLFTSTAYGNTIAFSGGDNSTLVLDTPAYQGTIAGFGGTDRLDLHTLAWSDGTVASYANGTLTVGSVTLQLSGDYTNQFVAEEDATNDTVVTYAPCFAAGTRILTEHGEVPVETLRAGDRVPALLQGGLAAVRWIGHRHVDCRNHPRPQDVWPVRVRAHAFGRGLPHRTLTLSPDHAVYVDDVLVPIRYLVNGATIVQEPAETVTWFHVELERHDVLLAEGLPAESYLDTGNRAAFANGGKVVMAHPDFALRVWEAEGCAPLVYAGPLLAAVQRRLLAQAEARGHVLTDDPGLRVLAAGRVLRPEQVSRSAGPGGLTRLTWEVALPKGRRRVRLASRAFVPSELFADNADHRRLGVAVESLLLDGVPVPQAARLSGWLPAEDGLQWTDGLATLATGGALRLGLSVLLLGHYWEAPGTAKLSKARALPSTRQRPEAFGNH
jgi:hypothetical protein